MAPTDVINRRSQRSVPVWLFALVVALVAGRIALKQVPRGKQSVSRVKWVEAGEATRLARERGQPIMYEFTADWCPPCRQMEDQVFSHPATADRINSRFIPVRLVDRQREEGSNPPHVARLQQLYNVRGFPTVIFADADGNLKKRIQGYGGRAAFEQQLAALAD